MRHTALLLLILVSLHGLLYAQQGFIWPENEEMRLQARSNYIRSNDLRREGLFEEALPPIQWLLQHTPDLNRSIYINAQAIFSNLADQAKTEERKLALADSLMTVFDMRMLYYGDASRMWDRKMMEAYKYYRTHPEKYEWLLGQFEDGLKESGEQGNEGNLLAYMDIIRRGVNSRALNLDEDEILERYEEISRLLQTKLDNTEDEERLLEIRKQVDLMLIEIMNIDCQFVEQFWAPRLDVNSSDLKIAKKIVLFSMQNNCIQTPHFRAAAGMLYQHEPDYALARLMGNLSKQERNWDQAGKYFSEAVGMTNNNARKAETLLELGELEARRGRKAQARTYFLQAVGLDNSRREAYSLIGNLYMSSFDQCKQLEDEVQDRAVYIAAYEMFKKAGNQRMMNSMKEQFPSMQEIFMRGYEEGQEIKIGCWINETVKIQRR